MPFGRKSAKPRAFLNEGGLYEYGVRSLGRQMRSEAELRRLMQKRVEPGELGEAAIAAAMNGLKEHGYLDDVAYGQTNEEALAREHLVGRRLHKPQNEKETARIMRGLVGAGFSTGVIYQILRQWDVPDEALAALERSEEEPHEE